MVQHQTIGLAKEHGHFYFAPNNMSNNGEMERTASNESNTSDQDVISLYYEGDLMLNEKRSCESMSSLDDYITNQTGAENIDTCFQSILATNTSYSVALKEAVAAVGGVKNVSADYIARKILSPQNDNMLLFLDELKMISASGYKFDVTMINRLMNYCVNSFNMDFHQFVLTKIIGNLSAQEVDLLNSDSFEKFVKRRLTNIKTQRFGLSRIHASSKHG